MVINSIVVMKRGSVHTSQKLNNNLQKSVVSVEFLEVCDNRNFRQSTTYERFFGIQQFVYSKHEWLLCVPDNQKQYNWWELFFFRNSCFWDINFEWKNCVDLMQKCKLFIKLDLYFSQPFVGSFSVSLVLVAFNAPISVFRMISLSSFSSVIWNQKYI